ncbi:SLC13 family permease [Geothrix sp. 21YS21S-2]|uniref:SLC13 family permease n=1 Tax=Geothrix sp. 21YS21S-2 TaxID=3068893 RepID=UPI0027BA88D7|nr:SLC13 family permease [Geothrix sp. 21YS21S-2]
MANEPTTAGAPPAPPSFFTRYKREIGALLGIFVCLLVWFAMPAGPALTPEGRKCLALSLLAVIWWAMGVAHPGFTALFLLLSWVLTKAAPPAVVFRLWTTPLIYIVVGGYMIAAAVENSGLGKRIAYNFILKYVNSFTSIVASGYILGLILSFMIPHPWPRSFMIMAVMGIIIKATKLEPKYAASIGLSVFAGSVPISMILLTGDSAINVVAMNYAGMEASWLKWALYMGVPGVIASLLTFFMHVTIFKAPKDFKIQKEEIREQLKGLGAMNRAEKVVITWVSIAILFWATDFLHHIHPGWIALGAGIMLSMPTVGDVLKAPDWNKFGLGTLFFLTAALGIGTVGGVTGMNKWLAGVLLPSTVPSNIYVLALMVTVFAILIHMCLGSVLAVMGIVTPTIVAFTAASGLNPLVPALLVYTAVGMHFVLPFHHMNVLVGSGGETGGKYTDMEVVKFGIPMTAIVLFTTVFVEITWWKIIHLIK